MRRVGSWVAALVPICAGTLGLLAFAAIAGVAGSVHAAGMLSVSTLLLVVGSLLLVRVAIRERHAAERNRPWFHELAQAMGEAFWVYDPERRRIEYADPLLERIWGTGIDSAQAAISALAWDSTDVKATLQTLLESQTVGAEPGHFDYPMRRRDGSSIWVRTQYVKISDPASRRELVVGRSVEATQLKRAQASAESAWSELEARVRDRTAELSQANDALSLEVDRRRQVQHDLRVSNSRLQALLDHTFDMYFELDGSGRFVAANSQLLETLCYTEEELIGLRIEVLLEEPRDGASFNEFPSCSESAPTNGTSCIRTREGVRIHMEWGAVPIRDETGGKRRFVFARDITDRVVAEYRFSDLFDSSPDAGVAIDSEGNIVEFNRASERLFGWATADVVGKSVEILIPERYRSAHAAAMKSFMHAPGQRRVGGGRELRALRADGSEVPVEISLAALSPGDDLCVVAALRDLTARLQAEAEAELLRKQLCQSQKLDSLGALAGGVAHDFNNLLAAVVNYANLALLHSTPDPHLRDDIARIKQAAGRMSELASQMLTYAGRGTSSMEQLDLNSAVHEMRTLLTSSLSKNAILEEDLCSTLPAVTADPAQLRQIIMNLIINASEALDGRIGRIRIRTGILSEEDQQVIDGVTLLDRPPKGAAYLEVSDTGDGMDADTVEHMFEPFYSTKQAGRGLGLATVMGIVRSHGGGIDVQSAPGAGTRILVAFPRSRAVPGTAVVVPAERRRLEGVHVLVVDDEDPVRDSAGRYLEARGATVTACADGQVALRVLRESRDGTFDAVLLDLTMPGLGGRDVLREIRKMMRSLPVALCSGYRPEDIEIERDPYLIIVEKPYDLDEVMGEVLGLAHPD